MKKLVKVSLIVMLLVTITANSACAHVKPYSECKKELDAVLDDWEEITKIRGACWDYINAFNSGDYTAMDTAVNTLIDVGLLPSGYENTAGNTRLFEILYNNYSDKWQDKRDEVNAAMQNCSYWDKHLELVGESLSRASEENIPLVPFPWDCSYTSDALGEFEDDFFDEGKDLTGSEGNIYFIEATMLEAYPERNFWLLTCKDKLGYTHRIVAAVPDVDGIPKDDISDMPEVGESAYFYLIYWTTMDNGTRFFFIGINDTFVELTRSLTVQVDPGEE